MEQQLRNSQKRVVGVRQVQRAIIGGRAATVFLCKDADDFIYRHVQMLCDEHQVSLQVIDSMQELGKLCMVGVQAATAALLK